MFHNDPYSISSVVCGRRTQFSTAWQDLTTAACLNLLATVNTMSFDRPITSSTSFTTQHHKPRTPEPQATLSPPDGVGCLGNGPPECKAFLRKMQCGRGRRHNIYWSFTDPHFPSKYHSHPVRHRWNSGPMPVHIFLINSPSQGIREDLNHNPRSARTSSTATVPKPTYAGGNIGPDHLRSIDPIFFTSFNSTSSRDSGPLQ